MLRQMCCVVLSCFSRLPLLFATALASVTPLLAASVEPGTGTNPATQPLPLLHPLFADHAVLQRGRPVPVWGWSHPGAAVSVAMTIAGLPLVQGSAVADATGRWQAVLDLSNQSATTASLALTVGDGEHRVTASDLRLGEVWICAGQSNMSFPLSRASDAATAIPAANEPDIRLFNQPSAWAVTPQAVPAANWQVCTPDSAAAFSAVGYHFAHQLRPHLGVPIGLISAAFSGTAIEGFISDTTLHQIGGAEPALASRDADLAQIVAGTYDVKQRTRDWWSMVAGRIGCDPGQPYANEDGWTSIRAPGPWEEQGHPDQHGFVWYRRTIDLPDTVHGQPARLDLGPIDDQDLTWINGVQVGAMANWVAPRHYDVPKDVLHPGHNLIQVRVYDLGGVGGFTGAPDDMALRIDHGPTVALNGEWQAHFAPQVDDLPPMPVNYIWPMTVPAVQYNRLVAPIAGFPAAGVLWYQGESNANTAYRYPLLLTAMIREWRQRWQDPQLPFFLVQVAGIGQPHAQHIADHPWANLMAAQVQVSHSTPRVFLATAADLGLAEDIHPPNKVEVARRLLYPALAQVYGDPQDGVAGSPEAIGAEANGGSILLRFSNPGSGLHLVPGTVPAFALTDEHNRLYPATATIISANEVVVAATGVDHPRLVQFNYDNNPAASLVNGADLPVVPFRLPIVEHAGLAHFRIGDGSSGPH